MPLESAGGRLKLILSVSYEHADMSARSILGNHRTLHSFGQSGAKSRVWSNSVAVEAAAMEAIQHPMTKWKPHRWGKP
ncbi:unnamed protein product [Staurois parvus]|uniref:Uncharacterized protein n=1 Tax=Staurois parvus TaxID=386267 RepID=A0ABN9F149_9NEOB|nr:unnamed protein product [Staurois parvus]